MHLQDFFDYKNQLMQDMLTNERIVSLIDEHTPIDRAAELAYKNVMPFQYFEETIQDGRTLVCFDVDISKALNKTYYIPTLYVWVFAHSSKLRLPEGGVRTDELCSEISKLINGSRKYGLGALDLVSVRRFAPMTDYQGKVLMFETLEFNRSNEPRRDIPSNRKREKK